MSMQGNFGVQLALKTAARHSARAAALVAMSCLLWSCTEVVPTTSHAPVEATKVALWQDAPWGKKYENLGEVTWTVAKEEIPNWGANADATKAIESLRESAAKLGANALLLKDLNHSNDKVVGAKFDGQYYLVPYRDEPKSIVVQAIYIHPDK